MKWEPKTEEQVMSDQLCPKGKNPFTVMECSEVDSKSDSNAGKPMIKLKLNVHAEDADYHIYDYVMYWAMEHKFRHFFYAIGRGKEYETGNGDCRDYVGLEGWCDVGHRKDKQTGRLKETIQDYVTENAAAAKQAEAQKATTAPAAPTEEDDVPF